MTNGDDFPHGTAESYRLEVDGDWELLELSDFGRQYVQVYSLIHALHAAGERGGGALEDWITRAFRVFPWRGGWSSVNFFKSLIYAVPDEYTPRVGRIEYASPGSIELQLAVRTARQTQRMVDTICSYSVKEVHATYERLHRDAKALDLLRRDVKLQEALEPPKAAFAAGAADELIRMMGMQHYTDQLKRLTQDNPLSLMKVVFALYRRVRVLAELQDSKKIRF